MEKVFSAIWKTNDLVEFTLWSQIWILQWYVWHGEYLQPNNMTVLVLWRLTKNTWWGFEETNTCILTSAFRLEMLYDAALAGNYCGFRILMLCPVWWCLGLNYNHTTISHSTYTKIANWWRNGNSNPAREHLSRRADCQLCNSRDVADFPLASNDWAVTYFVNNRIYEKKRHGKSNVLLLKLRIRYTWWCLLMLEAGQ